jgi:hypothetical protein
MKKLSKIIYIATSLFILNSFIRGEDDLHYNLDIPHTYDIDYESSFTLNGTLFQENNSFKLICIPKDKFKKDISWDYNTFQFLLNKKGGPREILNNNPYGFNEIIGKYFYGDISDKGQIFSVDYEIHKGSLASYFNSVNDLNDQNFALSYMKSFLDDVFVGLPLKSQNKKRLPLGWSWGYREADPRLMGIPIYKLLNYTRYYTILFSSGYIVTRHLSFSVVQSDYSILVFNINSTGIFDSQKNEMGKNVVIGNIRSPDYDYHWKITVKPYQ